MRTCRVFVYESSMRAFPTSSLFLPPPAPAPPPRPCPRPRSRIINPSSFLKVDQTSAAFLKPHFHCHCDCLPSSSDSNDVQIENGIEAEDKSTSVDVDGVEIEIEKLPNNSRRIVSSVAIAAPLEAVWTVLTDYERLSDFIPALSVSRLLLKSPNYARLFQIGSQDLALGLKFKAKGILDCYEKPLETIPSSSGGSALKRDIEFEMVQGDFEIFRGKWSLQQHLHQVETERGDDDGDSEKGTSTLVLYMVDIKPKLWLPVRLVEGRLCNDIKINLACIRRHARNTIF